jgi:uncharacterized protein (DUF2147 family)
MKFAREAAFGLLAVTCLLLGQLPHRAFAGEIPLGTWISEDGGVKVRLSNCGGTRLCATVVWLGEPIDHVTGRPKTDKNNPDPAKRGRPLIGLHVAGFSPSGPNEWSGMIYDADDGHTYQAQLKVRDAETLRLQGCIWKYLCMGHTWIRDDTGARTAAIH